MIYHRDHNWFDFSPHIHVFVIMKKIFLSIIILSCIILSWCEKKAPQVPYNFESFHWYFNSENYYNQSTASLEWLGYQLLQNDIIAIYRQQNSSWFINSIIIAKRESDDTVDDFVSENLKLITNNAFKTESNKTNKFKCNWNSIKIITTNSKVKTNLDTIYISQSFFKKDGQIYIISFSTLDDKERNSFGDNIPYLSCD
jgi:hypothetical protein